jgi:hypothetical protein
MAKNLTNSKKAVAAVEAEVYDDPPFLLPGLEAGGHPLVDSFEVFRFEHNRLRRPYRANPRLHGQLGAVLRPVPPERRFERFHVRVRREGGTLRQPLSGVRLEPVPLSKHAVGAADALVVAISAMTTTRRFRPRRPIAAPSPAPPSPLLAQPPTTRLRARRSPVQHLRCWPTSYLMYLIECPANA